jgi:hypothetical protein
MVALNRYHCETGKLSETCSGTLPSYVNLQVLFTSKLAEGRPELMDIYKSTEALLFLGTPHRGSDYAAWGKIAERIVSAAFFDTNGKTLEHLTVNGEHLAQLAQNFEGLLYNRTFSIYSYQEAKGYKGVKLLNNKVCCPSFWSIR